MTSMDSIPLFGDLPNDDYMIPMPDILGSQNRAPVPMIDAGCPNCKK